jgi:hypothetical protein
MSNEGPSQRGAEFQLQPVPSAKRKRSTANNERPRLWPAPVATLAPAPQIAVRPARLRRSQSVPNLKALCTTDLKAKARHHIPMPARMAHASKALKGWSVGRPACDYSNSNATMSTQPSSSTRTPPPWLSSVAQPIARLSVRSVRPSPIGPSSATTFAQVPQHNAAIITPSHLPPINSQTLKELDLHEILKNPQLRHDLVFDADLQFRPNFDGERGRRKRDLNNKYWRAVQREIQTRCSCTSFYGNVELPCACASYRRRRGSGPAIDTSSLATSSVPDARFFARIPVLIAELRFICLSVLPAGSSRTVTCPSPSPSASSSGASERHPFSATSTSTNVHSSSPMTPFSAASTVTVPATPMSDEHTLVAQCLDPSLIMQQLHHGALDVASLISRLGAILKQHCAPMRDSLIDNMVSTVMQHGDVTRSLRQCFEILELMKLDVANHQLSTSRIYLVETAPEFESRWIRDQMSKGKMTLQRTLDWFSQALLRQQTLTNSTTRNATITAAFDQGLIDLIFDPPAQPSTPELAFANLPSPSRFSSFSGLGPQNLAAIAYPETFQFDAFRLLTFHGEVTDITVVSMLLLLFRQMACSQQSLSQQPLSTCAGSSSVATKANTIASAQMEKVKCEIWTLLRENELEMAGNNALPLRTIQSPSPATPGGVAGRVLDSRLSSWRKVIGDLVLQIASRAIQVQCMAREEGATAQDCDSIKTVQPPNQATIGLLTRWLETNLESSSQLFTLCRTRVRARLVSLLACDVSTNGVSATASKPNRKRSPSSLSSDHFASSSKRCKIDGVRSSVDASTPILDGAQTPDDGLSPFAAEIGLLAERIGKVKSFHLTVYRPFYECMAANLEGAQKV